MKRNGDADFYRGFAVAIAALIREHDQPTMALDIMHHNGVTIDDLRKAQVDGFDLRPIGRAWREAVRP